MLVALDPLLSLDTAGPADDDEHRAGVAGIREIGRGVVQHRRDEFRGRVFAVYDVVVNGSIVSCSIIAALLLPQSGDSWLVPLLVAISYFLIATIALRPQKFFLKGGDVLATN